MIESANTQEPKPQQRDLARGGVTPMATQAAGHFEIDDVGSDEFVLYELGPDDPGRAVAFEKDRHKR